MALTTRARFGQNRFGVLRFAEHTITWTNFLTWLGRTVAAARPDRVR